MAARDYQAWAVQQLWEYFRTKDGNPVIAMPTGTGKSHVIADALHSFLSAYPMTRAMVLTHVKELISQNYSKFLACWPNAPAGIYSAGLKKKESHFPITFGGIASVAKKAHEFGHIDILFVDECDLINPVDLTMYTKFITALKVVNPFIKVIGLTATPWRSGFGHITGEGGLFTDVAVDMTGVDAFNWFIQQGYLVPLVPRPTKMELNVDDVHMRGGDFIPGELQKAVDKQEITQKALREAMEIGHDRHKWLIFASGVEHARHIADELTMMGISCRAIYSGMDDSQRDQIISDYKAGRIKAISNNSILTTGFDDPEIDFIVMLRPTGSSRLWVQMLGRGTRPLFMPGFDLETTEGRIASIAASQKQNTMVLDFAANIRKLGPINDPVIPGKKGSKAGPAPVKLCMSCNTYNHSSVRFCHFCGAEFTFAVKLNVEASTEQLIKADLPIVEDFKVDHITYTLHTKVGSEPMLRVTYYCSIRNFTDYVCLQHPEGNYALLRAKKWWKERSPFDMPRTVDDALEKVQSLKSPTHLRIWINKKYPEIMGYCYDATAFDKIKPEDIVGGAPPKITVTDKRVSNNQPMRDPSIDAGKYADMDDDIPF
jgi:DNA repair protein RadD